jgi:hypothetical protein
MSKATTKIPGLPPGVEFYMYVGLCITAWAKIDEELFDILVDVLETSREKASIIYYRINMLAGRMGLVDELTTSILPKPEKKNGGHHHPLVIEWTNLRKAVEGLFSTRTQIAHHPTENRLAFRWKHNGEMVQVADGTTVSLNDVTWSNSYSIYVGQAERLRGRHEQVKPLTADELSMHCQHVQAAAQKLENFRAARLVPHLKSAPKATAPASGLDLTEARRPKVRRTRPRS